MLCNHNYFGISKLNKLLGGIQLLRLHLGGGGPSKSERIQAGAGGCHINANVRI